MFVSALKSSLGPTSYSPQLQRVVRDVCEPEKRNAHSDLGGLFDSKCQLMCTEVQIQFAAQMLRTSYNTSEAISINLRLQLRGPRGEDTFTNMAFFGFVFISDVELCTFRFVNTQGLDLQLM